MLSLAWDLEVKLPGTRAAFRSGVLRQSKAEIIARATTLLDPGEARAAEAMVLDRTGRLTPGGLRSAITRAVIDVAPEKARKRREKGESDARVQRWMEDSGNATLTGRELPPADVLAADRRITWWAKQLRQAGLDGDMDQLRARAYLSPATWPAASPPAPRPPTASPSPTTKDTPSATDAPGPDAAPRQGQRNGPDPAITIRPAGPAASRDRDSPSGPQVIRGRPADTVPGGSRPGFPARGS